KDPCPLGKRTCWLSVHRRRDLLHRIADGGSRKNHLDLARTPPREEEKPSPTLTAAALVGGGVLYPRYIAQQPKNQS
ncbi:MAG TPA: hypothetical protein VL912_08850, partial [Candidatus Udaeobacter sp.]|nr:hypothetical protein [Candidatus Udaeobacter sp.]